MDFGFGEDDQAPYGSCSQNARVWTERWVAKWVFCPNCGNPEIKQFETNRPVADFHCVGCLEEYELKSQRKAFGRKIVDGAYETMLKRLRASNNPSLLLLNYDFARRSVTNVLFVPKQFFVPEIIERRPPLAATARRAGWTGCKILYDRIPQSGRVPFVDNEIAVDKEVVLARWQETLFLRQEPAGSRGWLIEVMRCIEVLGMDEFALEDMYAFEPLLKTMFPNNRHVKDKIRQQLQLLRDHGRIDFIGRGRYRLRRVAEPPASSPAAGI